MKSLVKLSVGATALAGWMSVAGIVGQLLLVEEPLDRADVIVVLSGSAEFQDRARTAAQLWKKQTAPDIYITDDGHLAGWDAGLQRNPAFFELTKRTLEAEGVPGERISVIPGKADGTHDEALLISKFLSDRGVRSAVLVTSGFHTRRTRWTFERISSSNTERVVYGISCPETDKRLAAKAFWWLTSSGWRDTPVEVLKLMYYRWVY